MSDSDFWEFWDQAAREARANSILSEAELTNPETQPNPLISRLLEISHELFVLSGDIRNPSVAIGNL